jgi:predicted DNA helicase
VIVGTLVGTINRYIEQRTFHTVFIDEAAQALEPAAWIPICRSHRVVLAGDPHQLPPTVKSAEAVKGGYAVTLLEKAIERLPQATCLLDVQYRMNHVIMGFSNQQFYGNKLRAADFVKYRELQLDAAINAPLEFIDTAGCGYEEHINRESLSRYNPDEYVILRQHLDALLTYATQAAADLSIGIISPYREQVMYMQQAIASDFDHFPHARITVDTIDSFQGQERDVIYISMVRSNGQSEIGFLRDFRRMNVALTRARRKLVVIGDSATLAATPFYADFISYCEQHDAYRSAWEWVR